MMKYQIENKKKLQHGMITKMNMKKAGETE
jgi:hypothetical protein